MRAPRLLLRLTGKALALMALLVVFAAGTANAQAVCYVDTGGDDAQNGQTPATANETIAGCLAEGYVTDGTIISIEAGTYDEAVTVAEDLIFEARESGAFRRVLIDDLVTIDADVTFRQDTQAGTNGIFRVGDGVGGGGVALALEEGSSLTVANSVADGRLQIPDDRIVQVDDEAAVTGEITYLGAVHLEYLDADGSDTDVTAGGEFPDGGDFAGGSLWVNLMNDNTLTFATATGLANLEAEAGSSIDGTIVVDDPIVIDGAGNVGSLDVNDDVTVGSDVAVGDVDIANDNDILFALGGFTLTVNGDFVRLGGTFTAGAGSEIAFRGDDADATFGPGPNFEVGTVTIDKDGQTLDITEDVTVTAAGGATAFSVATGTTVDFSGEQVNIDADGVVDIDGAVTDLSTVVFREAGADLQGDGTYGDILVTTAPAGDITVGATTQEDVVFTGTLTLASGGITVGGDDDLSPAEGATVSVNLATAGQDIAGSFNADDNGYNLEYTGDLATAIRTVGSEFATNDLIDVTFDVSNGTVDADAAGAGTISGDVTLSPAEDAYVVLFPDDVTIQGNLSVGDGATLDSGLADADITLEGSANSVEGVVAAPVDLVLEDGVTLTGTTDDDLASTVDDVSVATDANATITNIQAITGTLTTGTGSTLNLTLADEMVVAGNITLNGASLTLGSDVDAGGDVAANSGILAFGGNDLMVAGNFIGAADVDYTSSGGELVLDTAAKNFSTAGEAIPQVRIAGVAVTQTGDVEITTELSLEGAGNIDMGANDLTIGGALVEEDGGIIIDGTGLLTFNTTDVTLGGNTTISNGLTIADNETVTIESDDPDVDRTLTIADGDLVLEGTLALGDNDVNLAAGVNLVNDTGAVTAGAGEFIITGGNVDPGSAELDIPNVTTDGVVTILDDGSLRVTGQLELNGPLNETDTADDNLIIGSLATITMNAGGDLSGSVPTFEGLVSVIYNVASTTGNEVPAEPGNLQDLEINAAVDVDQDVTVNGTLLVSDVLTTVAADDQVTLASGATLLLQDGFDITGADIRTTMFNLTVDTTGPNDLTADVLDFVDTEGIQTLTVSVTTILNVDEATTIQNVVLDEGELELNANLTLTGDLTFAGGTLDNDGTRVALIFGGDADQMLTLDGDYEVENIDFTLAKEDTSLVVLASDNGAVTLDFLANEEILNLHGGILQTTADADVQLFQDNTTQGYDRDIDEEAGEVSHIAGNVTKFLEQGDPFASGRSARYEFPTGSSDGDYRPYVLTFRENVVTNTFITVNHQDQNPGGTLGLPITDDTGLLIGNYPDYYWLVDATTSLGQAQAFDVELTATEIGIPFTDEDDLRIIRRFDGDATTNEWRVQGDAANYDNFVSVEADDTTAVVRVLNSTGGIVTQGARFTLGLPTRAPLFTNAVDTLVVNEGEVATFDFDADPQDLGESVTYALGEGAPEWVTLDTETGLLTVDPGFEDAGTYTVEIIADDESSTTTHVLTIIVRDVFEITPAVGDTTIADGETLAIDFDVSNPNPADPVSWSLADSVDNAAINAETGEFTFTPDFEQSGQVFAFTVVAENSTDSVTVSFNVSVTGEVLLGDVNDSGAMTLADVSLTLAAVIGDTTLSSKAQLAADVSGTAGVSAFDAALMLQCLAAQGPSVEDTSVCNFPAEGTGKQQAIIATADIAWGAAENAASGVAVPVALKGTVKNVYSLEITADVDMTAATLNGVTGNVPDDWQVAWKADKETGTIRVAMFGATPISYEGEVVRLNFSLNDENSTGVNLQGDAFVNENPAVQLGSTSVKEIPAEFALSENYPNPFNPTTTFTYSLPEASHVTIEVYDVAGRLVQTLVNGEMEAGRYEVKWDGRSAAGSPVASGVYLYRMNAQSFTQVKTMMLVK